MKQIVLKCSEKAVISVYDKEYKISIRGNQFTCSYPSISTSLLDVPDFVFELSAKILLWGMASVEVSGVGSFPKTGSHAISYSGGVDSTAVLAAFGGVPIHIWRSYEPLYDKNQGVACKNVGAVPIMTDFEKVRILFVGKQGFNIGIGYVSVILPLAYALGIDRLMFGVVWDDVAFYYSKPFVKHKNILKSTFSSVNAVLMPHGFQMEFPLAGYSEVLAKRLCDSLGVTGVSSCHGDVSPCMKCYKCFRKQGMDKIKLNDISKIVPLLKKQPLKMAASTIYSIQKAGYKGEPFDRFHELDVSFCERVDVELAESCFGVLLDGFEAQTEKDKENIARFVEAINDPNTYK
jgi:hypothetical protein